MNQVQMKGRISALRANLAAGELVMVIVGGLKQISEQDRELLGAWCTLDEPVVSLAITPLDHAVVEMEAFIKSARVDLAAKKITVNLKAMLAEVEKEHENILAGLARYPSLVEIEISCAQLVML